MLRWQKISLAVLGALSFVLFAFSLGFMAGRTGRIPLPLVGRSDVDGLGVIRDAYDKIRTNSVDPPTEEQLARAAVKGMIELLKRSEDPYATFYSPESYRSFKELTSGEFSGIGIWLPPRPGPRNRLEILSVLPETPAREAGLRKGDIIRSIDGVDVRTITPDEAVELIKGPRGSAVELEIARLGEVLHYSIVRDNIELPNLEWRMTNESVGYIRLFGFASGAGKQLREALTTLLDKGAQGILLDLRNNPGGLFTEAVNVASTFIEDGDVVIYREPGEDDTSYEARGDAFENVPLVVLVNEASASAAEIVAGALKDNDRAELVGMTTYGKALVQEVARLDDGSALKLTTAAYLTPKGLDINGHGITPDVEVSSPAAQRKRAVALLKSLVASLRPAG